MSLESVHLNPDTVEDRRARGKAARKRAPRQTLGVWEPGDDRPDALGLLEAQNDIRVPDLVPIRYGRMSASPWTYLRGAAAVMASDLAMGPSSGLEVQLCGDAHVLNFGLWATPERNLSFDLRDFDETHPGPFEWDVKRLATSLVVAARENQLGHEVADRAVSEALRAYQARMRAYTTMSEMEVWYDHIYVDQLLTYFQTEHREQIVRRYAKKGLRRTSLGAFEKLTAVVDGRRRIVDDPPLLEHIMGDDERLPVVEEVFKKYRASLSDDRRHLLNQFSFVDTARKVVGVGSVGMRVQLLLLQGRDGTDPLFLQIKQAGRSVLEAHTRKSRYRNHGARVINGQRLIQSATDIFVGWTSFAGMDFYVRQFRDMKIIPESAGIAPVLAEFATACGEVLARAHARSGDPIAIASYIGQSDTFERSVAAFARRYADQTERDHQEMLDAIASGRIASEPGW
jgi:uncharacterized protein (DUF2252 family)